MGSLSENSLMTFLVYFHFAIILIPLALYLARLEWKDWKDDHPSHA